VVVQVESPVSTGGTPAPAHPLAPLSPDEIARAGQVLREQRGLTERTRFVAVTLREPAKSDVLAGTVSGRRADVVLYDRAAQQTVEAVVELTGGEVESWQVVEGVQPSVMLEEFFAAEEITRADPRWQEAMRKRGVTDPSLCMLDPWATGFDVQCEPGRRLLKPLTFVRSKPHDNGYARPVEGLVVVIDLDRMEVADVQDHGVVPLPPRPGNYDPDLMTDPDNVPHYPGPREGVKPLEIRQPEGPSFTVDGHHVTWQGWDFVAGWSPREGLVLHQLHYTDRGRRRSVLHRASLAEMYVPYGDPAPTHRFKNVFDEGEYGIGFLANPLQLGCDCLGEIRYLDGVVNDNDGNPLTIPNAVCMHEEDFGVAWKHTDFRTEVTEVRRLRRFVVSCFCTVGNYEYGFFWYLYADGGIEFEVKLTGILSTGAVAEGEEPPHGTLIAPGLYGPHHQHFFSVRLDMAVDGPRNTVTEVDSVALPMGPGNEWGNAWVTRPTVIDRESVGVRDGDPLHGRYWTISNPESRNALGKPVAYKLQPGESVLPLAGEGSLHHRRARFAYHPVWVTRYDPAERYAAGDYPNQAGIGEGLPRYVQADRPLEGEDVVVWYTLGAHHVVRPEDWPVMPVTRVGFHLKPVGFFDGNPALDLPRSTPVHAGADGDGPSCH